MAVPTLNHIHFDTLESTNTYAREVTDVPQNGMVLITASRQSGGRGQKGNSFFSDVVGGIWASMVMRIPDIADHFIYNRSCALAIRDVVASCVLNAQVHIKWPNDIYIGNRKVCGILIETHPRISPVLIIGFGINVNIAQNIFPPDLCNKATSLSAASGLTFNIDELRDRIIGEFIRYTGLIDQAAVHEMYRRVLYRKGAQVQVNGQAGIFRDVAPDGQLVLESNGSICLLSSGPMTFDNL